MMRRTDEEEEDGPGGRRTRTDKEEEDGPGGWMRTDEDRWGRGWMRLAWSAASHSDGLESTGKPG